MNLYKLYIRDGRRFAPAIDFTGWYLNEDHTLSKTRTEKSIAICVLHTISKMVFCELNDNPPRLSWDEAKEYCSKKFLGNGRLPEIDELLMVKNRFKIFPEYGHIWSNNDCNLPVAKLLDLYGGFIDCYVKNFNGSVFAFLTVEL